MCPLLHTLLELQKSTDVSRLPDPPAVRKLIATALAYHFPGKCRTAYIELGEGHRRYLGLESRHASRLKRPFYESFGASTLGSTEFSICD